MKIIIVFLILAQIWVDIILVYEVATLSSDLHYMESRNKYQFKSIESKVLRITTTLLCKGILK